MGEKTGIHSISENQGDNFESGSNSSWMIVRMPELTRMTGLSKSTLYNLMNPKSKYYNETFPEKVSLSSSCIGWYRHEVEQWIAKRPKKAIGKNY